MTPKRALREEDGFTLLEMLVSLTLLSFLGLIIMGALSFGGRSWERIGAGPDIAVTSTEQQVLRALFQSAYPKNGQGAQSIPKPAMIGLNSGLAFSSTLPGWGEYRRIGLSFDRSTGELILTVGPDRVDRREPFDDLQGERIIVADNIEAVEFQYWPILDSGIEPLARWDQTSQLPAAIGVKLFYSQNVAEHWLFRTALTGTGSCIVDPVTRVCREVGS